MIEEGNRGNTTEFEGQAQDASPAQRNAGWGSRFPRFVETPPRVIVTSLQAFIEDASESQVTTWRHDVPILQREAGEVLDADDRAPLYSAILECQLPLESRRPDGIFLVEGGVLVLELKGKTRAEQADIDQVAAYARDLRAYHRCCHERPVHAVLVPMRSTEDIAMREGVWTCRPSDLDALVRKLTEHATAGSSSLEEFLDPAAYSPLPSLIQAARELFHSGEVRRVWRARAVTDPAVEYIAKVAHEAAGDRTRHLILVTGVPGSGKTLVGMRAVHAGYLDDLAVPRGDDTQASPALFLSGNGPLVQVLQHVLRGAGGGGRTFVRHIKDYLNAYVPRPNRSPGEHLLVFDEAQRAFTPDRVRQVHKKWPADIVRSEPRHFIDVCERMPEWSVLIGLIGTGQEIHSGEEGGLEQWRDALLDSPAGSTWTVHAPASVEEVFTGSGLKTVWNPALNLDTELRYHLASELHRFVACLLDEDEAGEPARVVADRIWEPRVPAPSGLRLWATRDLETAKAYLRARYRDEPHARYGLVASSRDKCLPDFGVDNSWDSTRRIRPGPWFADGEESPDSCRRLTTAVTEFHIQGLELEMALLCWGTDLRRKDGQWTDELARRYARGPVEIRDPYRLRTNAYRVLLTRGRDGVVAFVPQLKELDETWTHLIASGFRRLKA